MNVLEGNEWLFFTKSVLRTSYRSEYGHKLRKKHYANKPPRLMRHIIEFFTKPDERVLDPFAGVGGTLIGASLCGRKATGIEIEEKWIDTYHEVCENEGIEIQEMVPGDCGKVLREFADDDRIFDHITTDPPYSIALDKTMCTDEYQDWQQRRTNFDKFSDDSRDLRNLQTFDEYYDAMEEVGELMLPVLKEKGYLSMIIRDSYYEGEYLPVAYELGERMKNAGFVLKGIKIWYGTGARVRPYGYPYSYVPNIVHQNIIILRKGK
jgi:DNA modification methylase